MPGIIPSVEAALYKMNVNGAADVPDNGRRCQHYLKLRGLNSEQREDRDEGLIFIMAAARRWFPPSCNGAVAAIWRNTAVKNERPQSPSENVRQTVGRASNGRFQPSASPFSWQLSSGCL
jgi:hypothetical protein